MSSNITINEWMHTLERITRKEQPTGAARGWTMRELKRRMGIGMDQLRERVQLAVEAGLMRVERRHHLAIDGVMRKVPFYVPVRAKRGGK